jgi:hypothetical protein
MACTLISHPIRAVAGMGLLTIAWLAAPASSQAQPLRSAGAITREAPASAVVDGEGALLNTGPSGESAVFPAAREAPASVDGAAALLEQSGVTAAAD